MKVTDISKRKQFTDLPPNKAKFTQNEDLKQKLLSTGNALLIEGNTWGDTYWGICNGRGQNKLGKILTRVRND